MSAATPSRIRAWSSTERTRITVGLVPVLGLLPIGFSNLLSPEPKSATRFGFAVSNCRWNSQLDFRSRSVFAPDFQLPAKALRPFAHSGKPPVSCTRSLIGNLRINPTPVVSNMQKKLGITVGNLRFDLLRSGMAERVSQRLAGDAIDFITKNGIELSFFPFHQHAHARRGAVAALRGQFLAQCRQRLRYVAVAHHRLAQVRDRIPAFHDCLVSALQSDVERLNGFGGSAPGKHVPHRLQAEHQSLKTLQQRIVQVPRDARPLIDALFQTHIELLCQLPQPQLIESPKQCHKRRYTRQAEPRGLVVCRGYGKIQERSGFIPHTAVIASHDAEAVVARREIRIERLTASASVLPIAVPALQLVTKKDLFRRDEAERGVIYLQITNERGQKYASVCSGTRIVGLAVGGDLLDVHRRRKFVEGKVARIDDADAVPRQEQQFSIGGLGDLRAEVAGTGKDPDSIGNVENRGLDEPLRIFVFVNGGDPTFQLVARDAHQAAGRVQPEGMVVVFHPPMDRIAGQSILAGQSCNTAVFQPAEPALGGGPQRTLLIESKVVDTSLAQPVGGRVRRADPTVPEIGDTTVMKSKP